jgi:hypothetical protein
MYPNPLEDRETVVAGDKTKTLVEVLATVYDNGNGRAAFVCLIRDSRTGKLSTVPADTLIVNDRATANLG